MLKYANKFLQIFIDFLVFIVTILILFSLFNIFSMNVLKKNYVSFLGYSVFEIASGSMEPVLNVDDLIVVKKSNDIKVGDIVTYIDGKDFITHRVISVNGIHITTKGDANNSEDVNVNINNIIGKVVFDIPKGGMWKNILISPKVIISLVITLVMISLCISYIPKSKRRIKKDLDNYFVDDNDILKK